MQNITKVGIIHGYAGSSAIHWQTWLSKKCNRFGIETYYPKMPEIYSPKLEDWLGAINKEIQKIDEHTALIGHSLGCPTILHFLKQPKIKKIGKVILVSPSSKIRVQKKLPSIIPFFEGLEDYVLCDLRHKIVSSHIFASDNDEWVDVSIAKKLASALGSEFHLLHNAGHISVSSGYHKFQEVFDLLANSKQF